MKLGRTLSLLSFKEFVFRWVRRGSAFYLSDLNMKIVIWAGFANLRFMNHVDCSKSLSPVSTNVYILNPCQTRGLNRQERI